MRGTLAFLYLQNGSAPATRRKRRTLPCALSELTDAIEELWWDQAQVLLSQLERTQEDLAAEPKSADWKVALADAMKLKTTATNRWMGERLHLGSLHEVSRLTLRWS